MINILKQLGEAHGDRCSARAQRLFLCRAQEVAGNNGVALWGRTEEGFATDPIMVANNLIFVATRIQIQMDSYPKWCVQSP